MTEQELQVEIEEMWGYFRSIGDIVVDAPALKVSMPYAAPYEGVCFYVETDGVCSHVSIPADQVERLADAMLEMMPQAIALEQAADAEIAAHEALIKAKG